MLTGRGGGNPGVVVGVFTLAGVWSSRNGGWEGEGCGGNCASCHQRCENPKEKKDS